MKSIVFATAMAVGSFSPVLADQPIFHDGIMEVIFSQEYSEIAVEKLPETIKTALEKEYTGAVIDKAYVNDEDEYKLEVTLSDETIHELHIDSEGNWIQK